MSTTVNLTDPVVFVDDHDPAIVYQGPWVATSGIPTNMNISTVPSSKPPPYYGTLHTIQDSSSDNSGFWYIFNGTSVGALFVGISDSITLCTIDGVKQLIVSATTAGQVSCSNTDALPQGQHNLSVKISLPEISFDGLRYTTTTLPESGVDLTYDTGNQQAALREDHTYLIKFYGNSIALYAYTLNSVMDIASYSYLIDEGTPLNFSLSIPAVDSTVAPWPWLFIQTPSLSQGSHTLRLTIVEDSSNVGELHLAYVIVQNTTKSFTLDAVPWVNHPATLTSAPSFHRINRGAIAGVVVTGLFMLFIGFWIWKRAPRKQVQAVNNIDSIIQPFSAPDPLQIGRFPLAQYTTMEKTRKYREVFGLTPERLGSSEDVRDATEMRTEEPLAPAQARQTRYRFHEDEGQVADSQHHGLDEEEDVISLPPIYSTLGRPRADSLRAESLASLCINNPIA